MLLGAAPATIRARRVRSLGAACCTNEPRPTRAAASQLGAAGRPRASGTTPQRAGEAAWHRRARRQRGAARTLLRVAAAASALRQHHSAARPMRSGRGEGGKGGHGGKGKGGGGGQWEGSIAEMLRTLRQQNAQQQQLLQALESSGNVAANGARSGLGQHAWHREGGGLRGGGDKGWNHDGARGGKGDSRGRPGDWVCDECGAFPCFARATRCYMCRAPRRGGAPAVDGTRGKGKGRLSSATVGSAYLGPVGAYGNKPLLGRREEGAVRTDDSPSYRVPGASVAARAESTRERTEEEEGYKFVRNGGMAKTGQAAAAGAGGSSVQNKPPVATKNSWAALAEEEENEEDAMDDDAGAGWARRDGDGGDGGDADEDGREDHDDDKEKEAPSEMELRSRWQAHCALVRRLEKGTQPVPPGVLDSIRAQRDAAEQRWRAEKKPHPLSKRLRWAEADLRAAQGKEEARREELREHLERTAARTEEIKGRLAVDEARTARKQEALRELQRECGLSERPNVERAARIAVEGIASDIAPALSAIIEQLGEGEDGLRCDLQLLSTSLGRVEGVLREAAEEELPKDLRQRREGQRRREEDQPARFDISDDADAMETGDEEHDGGNDGTGNDGARKSRRTGSETKCGPTAATRWTKPAANAPWKRSAPSSAEAVGEARKLLQEAGAAAAATPADGMSPAATNDLFIAERRSREEAIRQQHDALQQQQRLREDHLQAQVEEQGRQRREAQRQEEMRKHLEAAEQAALAAAAEEAKRKEELWASMSPEQRTQATRLIEQQAAVGAHAFGTQGASHLAGLVQQAHVQEVAQAGTREQQAEDVDRLMAMSAEDFGQWNREQQSLLG